MTIFKVSTLALALSISLQSTSFAQNTDYQAGQKALYSENYFHAAEKFEQASVDDEYRQASWYWQAYSLYKIKQNNKAKGILKELLRLYPNGNWAESTEVLLFEHSKDKERSQEFKLNDELRLIAIEQLVFNNPEKGVPLVTDLLMTSKDTRIKRNALHLLGISNSNKAAGFLYKYILQEQDNELKTNAVQMLSLRNSQESSNLLSKLYKTSANRDIKSMIIQGYIHSDEPSQLLKLLKSEKDMSLNREMIQLLGIMGAGKQLTQLRHTLKDVSLQKALIQSLAISGDSKTILQMAEDNTNKEVQKEAIGSLVMLDEVSEKYLVKLYKRITDQSVKRELLSVFIPLDISPQSLLSILKAEENKTNKKQLVNIIRIVDGNKELFQYYQTETNQKMKAEVINMLRINDQNEILVKIYAAEEDEKLKSDVIHMLRINDQYETLGKLYKRTLNLNVRKEILHAFALCNASEKQQSAHFLINAYKAEDVEIKKIIIHGFLIQDNSEALLKLLKIEANYDLKKEIIQTLSQMDSGVILNKLLQEN